MDIYLTEGDFRKKAILDEWESLIWTARYSAYGDFELKIKQSKYFLGDLRNYQYVLMSESDVVMQIETTKVERKTDEENIVVISGTSIESFLANRNNKTDALREDQLLIGSSGYICNYLVDRYCINAGTAGAVNVIPNLIYDGAYPGDEYTMYVPRGDIYDLVKTIADMDGLGFKIRISNAQLVFTTYYGADRTNHTAPNYRLYTPDDDTLLAPSLLESIANYKNHARVLGNKTGVDVYSPGTEPTVSGFNRRTLLIEATDIGSAPDVDPSDEDYTTIEQDQAALRQRGWAELAKLENKYQRLIDGDIPQNMWDFTEFKLGDIVWVKDNFNHQTKNRIVEQIWSVDKTGTKRNPTFELVN